MRITMLSISALGVLLAGATSGVHAMPPDKFFQRTAPSVWRVYTYDADGISFAQGSAVVIGKETLLTNCHVLAKAKRFVVRQDNTSYDAKLQHIDVERDMCQITARNLNAPSVPIGDSDKLSVGQRVYTLGTPENWELTLSEGLISALRKDETTGLKYIQTTAPISHGSSGGGLFDEEGRLVGITTAGDRRGQNLNFAMPINYLQELPARSAAALAKRAVGAVPTQAKAEVVQESTSPSKAGTEGNKPALRAAGSSYADVNDVAKLIKVNPRARAAYETFLSKPLPRAFALSENGGWWMAWGKKPKDPFASSDPAIRVLPDCEKHHQRRCFVYAVDETVVWNAANTIALPRTEAINDAATTEMPSAQAPTKKEHMFVRPAPSGFAGATDSNAIPYIGTRGREGFVRYLTLDAPKAFAIGADGSWNYITDDPRAMKTALERCEAKGGACWLYAVDNEVVWRTEASERIRFSQLSSK